MDTRKSKLQVSRNLYTPSEVGCKMSKYEMDPTSIFAHFVLSTDGQTKKVKSVYHPFNFVEEGRMISILFLEYQRYVQGS